MRLIIVISALFFLSLMYSPLFAQTQNLLTKPQESGFIKEIGFSVGVGASYQDLKDFNKRLENLHIGKVDDVFASRTLSLYLAGKKDFKATMDVNVGTAFENSTMQRNAYLHLETFSIGFSLYKSILHTNRFEILVMCGFRFTSMTFEYNANTNSAVPFDSILSNSTSNASMVHLTSNANESLLVGGRFQYRLGEKENLKPREYKIGFDSGYIYSFRNSTWGQFGSSLPVSGIPKIKSDNFYFHLTFSGYFKL